MRLLAGLQTDSAKCLILSLYVGNSKSRNKLMIPPFRWTFYTSCEYNSTNHISIYILYMLTPFNKYIKHFKIKQIWKGFLLLFSYSIRIIFGAGDFPFLCRKNPDFVPITTSQEKFILVHLIELLICSLLPNIFNRCIVLNL